MPMKTAFTICAVMVLALCPAAVEAQPGAPGQRLRPGERAWIGLSFFTAEGSAAEVTVREVMPGTPAESAGIRVGDRIVEWNGRADVAGAIRGTLLQPGDTVRLRITDATGANRELTLQAVPSPATRFRVGPGTPPRLPLGGRPFALGNDSLFIQADSMQARLRVLLRDSLGARLSESRETVRRAQAEIAQMRERSLPAARIELLRADSIRRMAIEEAIEAARAGMMRVESLRFGDGPPGLGLLLAGPRNAVAGADVTDLTPSLGEYFGVDRGVLVLRAPPETPAGRAGLRDGDVIITTAGEAIGGVLDLRRAIASTRDTPRLELEVVRRGSRHTITIER